MPGIYRIAREAGFDPTSACCIDNSCFLASNGENVQPPPFTPIASAEVVGANLVSQEVAAPVGLVDRMRQPVRDVVEMLEDPRPAGEALLKRQRRMIDVREYDINGFRVPSTSYANER